MNVPARASLRFRLLLRRRFGSDRSSERWLERQRSDPYVEKAKQNNYRCRSAYKLIEINDRTDFLRPGAKVVDVGAAPGSWTQVAVEKVNADGKRGGEPRGAVFSLDLRYIYPIQGATVLSNCDFHSEACRNRLTEALNGARVDAVISDMAPNATGVKSLDHEKIVDLCYEAFKFAARVSKRDACFLTKLWEGGESHALELALGRFYDSVKAFKPRASRSDSSEKFLFARGFRGLAKS